MIILTVIFVIVAGIIIFVYPFFGLLATLCLIPQDALFFRLGNTFLGLFTIMTPVKIIGGVTFFSAFLHHIFLRKSWHFLRLKTFRYFTLFVMFLFISGFVFPNSFTRTYFTMFASFTMLGFSILSLVNSSSRFRKIIMATLISVFFASLNSIIIYATAGKTEIRMMGKSYGPNEFAIMLLPFLGIAYYFCLGEKNKVMKNLFIAITASILVALILSFSRGGLIGLFAMLIIVTLKAKNKLKAVVIMTLFVTILLCFLPGQTWDRFQTMKAEGPDADPTGSVQRRISLARIGWSMFLDNPIFGVGVGNYYWQCRLYGPVIPGRPHNMYLEILAEMGIIGFMLFLGIISHTFAILRTVNKKCPHLSRYARGIMLGLGGFLVSAIFLHAYHEKALWFIVFMSAALGIIAKKEYPEKKIRLL
ncbi:O-antigen ligase family protein [Candidatus Omnitrophota bacterium]